MVSESRRRGGRSWGRDWGCCPGYTPGDRRYWNPSVIGTSDAVVEPAALGCDSRGVNPGIDGLWTPRCTCHCPGAEGSMAVVRLSPGVRQGAMGSAEGGVARFRWPRGA